MASQSFNATELNAVTAVSHEQHVSCWYLATKRLIDIVGSVVALILFAPLMLLAAIAVKLDSPGPVLFSQMRLGRDGKAFRFYKFRSMYSNAEQCKEGLACANEVEGPAFKIRQDPRITRVGRVIRKCSIDETPQLLHVLRGQMSLVGPRPPVPEEVDQYEPWQFERLSVKPGLTCIWQVSGRSNIPFDTWVRMDIEYARNRNLWLDIRLLLLTIPAIITGRGAY